jgi:hypothetical protein
MKGKDRKPTDQEIAEAVCRMSVIPFFPAGEVGIDTVQKFIESMVGTTEQLKWLRDTTLNNMRKFSLPELRGIFCTKYRPADGIEGVGMETPGFMESDLEQAYHDRESRKWEETIAEWKREKLLEGDTSEPVPLPPVKQIPSGPSPREQAATAAAIRRLGRQDAEKRFEEVKRTTPRRTEEETARLVRELEEKLGIKKA